MTDDSNRMPEDENEPNAMGADNVPRHMAAACVWLPEQEEAQLPGSEKAAPAHDVATATAPNSSASPGEDAPLETDVPANESVERAKPVQALDEQLPTIEGTPIPDAGPQGPDDKGIDATGAVKAADVKAPQIERDWELGGGGGTLPGGRKVPHLLIAGVAAVLVATLGSSLILTSCFGLFSSPEIPNVVGSDATSAQGELESQGYSVVVSEQVTQNSDDAGRVLATEPPAGTKLPAGGDVTLKVGKSPEEAQAVPDLVDLTKDDAVAAIAQTKFFVKDDITFAYSDTIPTGTVISQGPEAGTMEVKGTKIDLVVSDGPNPDAGDADEFAENNEQSSVSVPDLRGMTVAKATVLLRGMGLDVVRGEAIPTDEFANGTVAAVDPSTDSVVAVGSTVTIHEAQPKDGTTN